MSKDPIFDFDRVRADTPTACRQVFLNSAGASLMPVSVVRTLRDYLDLEVDIGGYAAQAQCATALDQVYASIARLIHAQSDEIAFMQSATAAWQMALYSVPLERGDIVLTCEAEYAANYVALLQIAQRKGIVIRVVPSCPDTGVLDLEALARMMTPEVRLVSLTWVPTNGGLVNPAAAVGRIAREHGVAFLLDACQALGQIEVDVQALGCDMLCATGRKFLRGPRGTGLLFVRRDYMPRLVPHTLDHFAAEWTSAHGYTLRDDARRYETWERNCGAQLALGEAVRYALSIGVPAIETECRVRADYLRAGLRDISGVAVHDLGQHPCAIVTFTVHDQPAADVAAHAAQQRIALSVSSPASTRIDATRRQLPDVVRVSPHYFNSMDDLDQLLTFVRGRASGTF